MIRPNAAQRALAYIATGNHPPLMLRHALSSAASTFACLMLGVLIGAGVSP
jgi:hypothetical protein